MIDLQSSEIRLQDYISVLYRKKWAVIVSFLLVTGVSTYYALSTPPEFTSSAIVEIETRTLNPDGEVVQDITQSVDYYERIFRTGIFQREVSDSLSADPQTWAIVDKDDVRLANLVRFNVLLERDIVQSFFRIKASAENPILAYRLADVSSRLFQRRLREIELQNVQDSDDYLDDQIARVQSSLEELEIRIRHFMRQNALVTIAGEVRGGQDFSGLQERLGEIRLREELTRAKLDSYRGKREELISLSPGSSNQKVLSTLREIRTIASQNDSLRSVRKELLSQHGDNHPDVRAANDKLDRNHMRSLQIEKELTVGRTSTNAESMLPILQQKIEDAVNQLFELSTDSEYYALRIRGFADENPNLIDEELEQELEYGRLQRSKALYETTYNMLIQRREEQRFRMAMQTGGVKMIDPADLPDAPIPTNAPRQVLFGAILGLSLGLGAAFLLEYMDTSLKSSEDVTRFLDLPLMGEIPKIKTANATRSGFWGLLRGGGDDKEAGYESRLISNFSPKEPIPEAYRNIRTSLQFASVDEPLECFVVSSPNASEGKSLTSANLAIGYAQSGKRIILIDTDLRRPVMHKIFGLDREPGITEVLAGQVDVFEAMHSVPIQGQEGLYVLPAGQSTPNPGELISSNKMDMVLEQLKEKMDIIMIDSPPVIVAVDAAILGNKTQGVLLIFHMDETKREAAKYCVEQLNRSGARVIGGVLNNIDVDRKYGYYYSYRYYYRYKYYYDSDAPKPGKN